jgi:50S ribosomal protein L16 3-hydroxylase
VLLFVDGQSYPCTGPAMALAMEICAKDHLEPTEATIPTGPARDLLVTLINSGALAFEAGEDWED